MGSPRDFRLSFWALCQYVYDLYITFGDTDGKEMRRELFRDAVFGGHLNRLCFVSMENDFPMLRSPHVLRSERLIVRFAIAHLDHYVKIGRKRSGLLKGYLLVQRDHLERCARCRAAVCETIREDIRTGDHIRDLFKDLLPEDMPPPRRKP